MARYCGACGATVEDSLPGLLPDRRVGGSDWARDWLTMDDVLYTRDRRLGAIGAPLLFLSAFLPWSRTSISILGAPIGSYGVGSPVAWLVALAGIAAGVFLFRPRSGMIVMVMGIVIMALALLSGLTSFSQSGSPSWGVLFALAGGGLLGYSGWLTGQYERSS